MPLQEGQARWVRVCHQSGRGHHSELRRCEGEVSYSPRGRRGWRKARLHSCCASSGLHLESRWLLSRSAPPSNFPPHAALPLPCWLWLPTALTASSLPALLLGGNCIFRSHQLTDGTTKGTLVEITAVSGLRPPAAEFLDSELSSLCSPPFQQQRLGFHRSSPESTESSEVTARKLPMCIVAQSCPPLCDLIGWSLPGSSVHGISQARIPDGLPFPSPGKTALAAVPTVCLSSPGAALLSH